MEWAQGPYYYGRSVRLNQRRANHFSNLKRGDHFNHKLQDAYDKYGPPAFKIVELCEIDDLPKREGHYIDASFGLPYCCNLMASTSALTPDTKARIARLRAFVLLNKITGVYFIGTQAAARSIGMNPATLRKKLSKDRKNTTPFIYFNNSSKSARDKIKSTHA